MRGPDGRRRRFDEIVTPHPVVAFLFRRRTFIVLVAVLVLAWWARPQPVMLGIGVVLAVLAECWRIWAAGTIHKTQQLTTGGPYAFVRHPLYLGSFGHSLAYCFMSGRWVSFLIVIPLFVLLYSAAYRTEEAMLLELYGESYRDYSRAVPRFVPRLRRLARGSTHGQFSWKQVLINKEYINIIWVLVLSALFVIQLLVRH